MTDPLLVQRLTTHTALAGVPIQELEWLAAHGRLRRFAQGDVLIRTQEPAVELYVVLSGHVSIRLGPGMGVRRVAEWRSGEVTGLLPYSRLIASPGNVMADEPSEALALHRDHFPELIRECHQLTSVLVHVMVDRARYFRSSELHDEKLQSLGRLAAGLAHELNNPASAVARSAKSLAAGLADLDRAARALAGAGLSDEQLEAVRQLRDARQAAATRAQLSPLELVEHEDAIADWMQRHQVDPAAADALLDADVSPAELDDLAALLDAPMLPVAFRYLAAFCATHRLSSEIETAASRIHGLVSAVKGFTYMDQATVPKPVDIGQGLLDSLTVLRAKARARKVELRHEIEAGLPLVEGFGGELNQVWGNLIDNALDAAAEAGHVTVTAARRNESIVVRVRDDGAGIPDDIRDRIFDPFFTTKGIGEGTGLGLNTVRLIVGHHGGAIEVRSGPGGTEFEVTLPLVASRPGRPAPPRPADEAQRS